jgi:hypothetical protein
MARMEDGYPADRISAIRVIRCPGVFWLQRSEARPRWVLSVSVVGSHYAKQSQSESTGPLWALRGERGRSPYRAKQSQFGQRQARPALQNKANSVAGGLWIADWRLRIEECDGRCQTKPISGGRREAGDRRHQTLASAKQSQFAWAQDSRRGIRTSDGSLDSRSPIGSRTSFAGMTSQAAVQNKANLPFQAADGHGPPCEAADGRVCGTKPKLGGVGYLGQTRPASEGVAERNRACETKPIGGLRIAECGLKRMRALMRNKANSLGPKTDLVGPGRAMGPWIPAPRSGRGQASRE